MVKASGSRIRPQAHTPLRDMAKRAADLEAENPPVNNHRVDAAVERYIDAISAANRPLFDRVHQLVIDACPQAHVVLSYQMPTYTLGDRRLHIGAWKHGVSIYGVGADRDAGFTQRHPRLKTSKGTIQLRPGDAAQIGDDELRDLARAALTG